MSYTQLKIADLPDDKLLMSARDAASWLGISKSHFYALVERGQLPEGFRVSERCVRWRVADVKNFAETLEAR